MRRLFRLLVLNAFIILTAIPAHSQNILLLKWIKGYAFSELSEPHHTGKPKGEFYLFTPSQIYLCSPKHKIIAPWGNKLTYLGITSDRVIYYKQTAVNGNTGIFSIIPQRRIVVETTTLINPLNQRMEVIVDYYQILRLLKPDELEGNYRNK